MPRPTPESVRKAAAERYGWTDLSDEAVNAILADKEVLSTELGLDEGPLLIGDLVRPVWSAATTPIVNLRSGKMGEATEQFAAEHPIIGRVGNFAADLLSSLSSPINLGMAAATGGASMAARAGLPAVAKGLSRGSRALSAPVAAEGVLNLATGETLPEQVAGGFETAFGLAGVRGPKRIAGQKRALPPTEDLSDLHRALMGGEFASPEDVAKAISATRSSSSAAQMIDELQAVISKGGTGAEIDAVAARYAPPPAAIASEVSPASLRAQRLVTEQARTRTAAARAGITERRHEELIKKFAATPASRPTPLTTAPVLSPAATPAERAAESAFPLSARTSDPATIPLPAHSEAPMPAMARGPSGRFMRIEPGTRTKEGKLKTISVGGYEIDLAAVPGGKLSADEIKDLILGQGKLLTQAKGKSLPKSAIVELDRMGLEYRRTATETGRLIADPMSNPMQIAQMKQAKRELGFRLAKRTRDVLREAMKDETGAANPVALLMLGRASATVAAGVTGYAVTDDPEDKLTNAALAALTVGAASFIVPSIHKAFLASAGRGGAAPRTAEEYMYASMLSHPGTIIRSTIGQLSGAAHGVAVRLMEGRVADARKIVTDIIDHAPTRYLHALMHGSITHRLAGTATRRTTGGIVGGPLRMIAASDDAVVPAMKKGGFSLVDAQRLTLQGTPQTEMGRQVVKLFALNWLGRLLQPFAKVGVHMVENPFVPLFRKDLSSGERLARASLTAVETGAAYAFGGEHDPRLDKYLIAAAGPNAIPVALGLALAWAQEQDKSVPATLIKMLEQLNPLNTDLRNLAYGGASRFVPGAAAGAAQMMDPEARERRDQPLASLRIRIPGRLGRESLPAREAPTDIFGAELPYQQPAKTAIGRLLLGDPQAYNLPTRYPHDNPVARELMRLGVDMQPPRGALTIKGKEIPVPSDVKGRVVRAKGQVMDRALSALMATPGYDALDDAAKAEAVDQVRDLAGRATGDKMRKLLMLAVVERLRQKRQ